MYLPIALFSLLSLVVADVDARATPQDTGISVNLARRKVSKRTPEEAAAYIQRKKAIVEAKYGIGSHKEKRATGMNLITNLEADSSYFGSIAVGTPSSFFDVILDTGSSDLWLASANVPSTNDRAGSQGSIALFDPNSSSTFTDLNKSFAIQYGSGAAQGVLGSDKVQFAGFELTQTFGVVNETTSSLLTSPLSGLMGLAFQSIAASGATPFWQALAETSSVLDTPLFAFQLTRYTNDTNAQQLEPGGTFTIGATNSSLYTGDIDYQDIPSGAPGYWIQELTSLTINGQSLSLPSGSSSWAAIDTGTTGVAGPSSILSTLYAAIEGAAAGTGQWDGYYTYPCSSEVSLSVSFGGSSKSWTISAADFAIYQTGSTCIGAFFEVNTSGTQAPTWIFGDTFLKNVYSVYRYSPASVGFAELSSQAISMNGADGTVPSATLAGTVTTVSATGTASSSGSSNGAVNFSASSGIALLGVMISLFAGALSVWVL